MRSIDGIGALIAYDPERVRIVSSTAGVTSLYQCRAKGIEVWSTHAVAAAWMAMGTAQVEPRHLPELIAAHFVGDERSLIRGVRAVDTATCVDLGAERSTSRSFYPARERWSLVPEADAYAAARDSLDSHVERHCTGRGVLCGITAGLDSRATAVALRRTGVDFEALTVGAPRDPDVVGGHGASVSLGVRHRVIVPEALPAGEVATDANRQVLWSEGLAPLSFHSERDDPTDADLFVTGGGGETGRAFYYDAIARSYKDPKGGRLKSLFRLDSRLRGAHPDARETLSNATNGWIEAAQELGLTGWRALDAVFAEQRDRRLSRALLRMGKLDLLRAFNNPAIQRALVSLPLEDRLGSAFHITFLRESCTGLVPAHRYGQRRGVPRPIRRTVSAVRALGSRGNEYPPPEVPSGPPHVRGWLADDVLQDPLLALALGDAWVKTLAGGVRDGNAQALEVGLLAAAPVILHRNLSMLPALARGL